MARAWHAQLASVNKQNLNLRKVCYIKFGRKVKLKMSSDFIPTKASLLNTQPQTNYNEVEYVAPKPKKKKVSTMENSNIVNETVSGDTDFNIRKAKNEVIKFGMSGFDPVKKEEAKIQQLIKLGAKPPKNKYKNYKHLITERKIEKDKESTEKKFQQLGKNNAGKSTAKGKSFDKKRRKEGILDIYGKIVRNREEKGKK